MVHHILIDIAHTHNSRYNNNYNYYIVHVISYAADLSPLAGTYFILIYGFATIFVFARQTLHMYNANIITLYAYYRGDLRPAAADGYDSRMSSRRRS